MAVEEILKDTKLRVKVNYGEVGGKIERGSKTYGDVRHDATKEQLESAYGHIISLQEPIGEGCERTTASDIVKTS
ncbi:hypothetical protein [Eubacterium sp. 1001713B170207_170306_E7]|uniref:DUF1659 domain-containing protein n=1 Tax=Eubacterium sp. 1001713B170207_170306_E7 TaxID=2787097 RepID=UPI00189B98F2|nr:hypothetical protein [Eubacterium sp. 1001713B170207_170306_E7]